jgi:alkylation response protein AidB-like acyl-CoA dehydrogenase
MADDTVSDPSEGGREAQSYGTEGCPIAHVTFDNVAISDAAVLGTLNQGSGIGSRTASLGSLAALRAREETGNDARLS